MILTLWRPRKTGARTLNVRIPLPTGLNINTTTKDASPLSRCLHNKRSTTNYTTGSRDTSWFLTRLSPNHYVFLIE